uniref:NADH-ubiquinone oxidoreductase B12 subunit n=1 Tax=Steinernema glaseri TaxID=37863 RepID=A0A1I7YNJ2_9BILA
MDGGSVFYHLRKRVPLYIWPVLAGSLIFIDWNHTRQWKNNVGLEVMGTFTVSYFAKKFFWERKLLCLWVPTALYFGSCWDRAGMAKAEMMKGHSRMYANRIQAVPKGEDPWKY